MFAQAISRQRRHSLDDDVKLFFALDAFGASVTVRAGESRIEPRTPTQPGTPAKDVTLCWPTFTAAADEAGWSRRYGGIHFEGGDLHGRSLGNAIGGDAWTKAQSYIRPFNTGPLQPARSWDDATHD